MGVISWFARFASKYVPHPVVASVGIARFILRRLISTAVKMDEALPDIKDTMKKVDPGQIYGGWAEQYRTYQLSMTLEQKLALWPRDLVFNDSVFLYEKMRRAAKYRYIFSMKLIDTRTAEEGWRMFSLYSDKLMTPQGVVDEFFEQTFGGKYENFYDYSDYAFKRVQVNKALI